MAQQFGQARGTGVALRSALGVLPDPLAIRDPDLEPHERGAILVSAVFDAYFTIYLRQTADIFRVFRAGGGKGDEVELPMPMAGLLADAATRTADTFFQICARAIDYCPPVDITFGDYLRALITADRDLRPADPLGNRDALMQAFRLRGIYPRDAPYFSEEALCWQQVAPFELPPVTDLIFGDPNGFTAQEKNHNREVLTAYARENATMLGLRSDLFISVPSFHTAYRVAPDGRLLFDMVVEIYQSYQVPFDKKNPKVGSFPMHGGLTLIISRPPQPRRGDYGPAQIKYLISKRLDDKHSEVREDRQRAFALSEGLAEGKDPRRFQLDFNLLHGGF